MNATQAIQYLDYDPGLTRVYTAKRMVGYSDERGQELWASTTTMDGVALYIEGVPTDALPSSVVLRQSYDAGAPRAAALEQTQRMRRGSDRCHRLSVHSVDALSSFRRWYSGASS